MQSFLIFLFGAIGGLLRLSITNFINYSNFPIATLIINLSGALFLPFWNIYLGKKLNLSKVIIQSIGTGLVGSLTTFSGMILDSFKLIENQQFLFFWIYLLISIVGGIVLALLSNRFATYIAKTEVV